MNFVSNDSDEIKREREKNDALRSLFPLTMGGSEDKTNYYLVDNDKSGKVNVHEKNDKRLENACNVVNELKKKMYDRDYILVKLGLNTAFRINDLLKLQVNENLLKGIMYIRENKTRKEQYWELNPKLFKDVMDYINRNNLYEGEYLFPSRKGHNIPITSQQAWNRIKKYTKELGIKYLVGCHSLRKCFARTFYEQTKDELVG